MDAINILVIFVIGVTLFLISLSKLRLARTVEDIPTSKIRSAHQGYVEIKGKTTLNGQAPLHVPRIKVPCVWYRYQEFREDQRGFENEEKSKESIRGIYVEDATGICVVHTHLAKIYPTKVVRHVEPGVVYEMSWIGVGDSVYTLGWLNTLHPAPRVDDVIAKETLEKGELRYGQIAEPLATITRHPQRRYPFFIEAGYEHRITVDLRRKAKYWLIASIAAGSIGVAIAVAIHTG